ncbi:hypothetical protein ScPMuIL_017978 [Solemya velum]
MTDPGDSQRGREDGRKGDILPGSGNALERVPMLPAGTNGELSGMPSKDMETAKAEGKSGDQTALSQAMNELGDVPSFPDHPIDDHEDFISQLEEYEQMTVQQCQDSIASGMNTVIIVDTSASMNGFLQKTVTAVKGILKEIENLAIEHDLEENVALITFGRENHIIQNLTNDFAKVTDALNTLDTSGPSPMYLAIRLSVIALSRSTTSTYEKDGHLIEPRVIVFTDGITSKPVPYAENEGDLPESFNEQIVNKEFITHFCQDVFKEKKIQLHYVPVGDGDKDLPECLPNSTAGKVVKLEDAHLLGRSHLNHCFAASVLNEKLPNITTEDIEEFFRQSIVEGDISPNDLQEIISICEIDSRNIPVTPMSPESVPAMPVAGARIQSSTSATPTPPGGHMNSITFNHSQLQNPKGSMNSQMIYQKYPEPLKAGGSTASEVTPDSQILQTHETNQSVTVNIASPENQQDQLPAGQIGDLEGPQPEAAAEEESNPGEVIEKLMQYYEPPDTSKLPIMPEIGSKVLKGPDWVKLYDKDVPEDETGEVLEVFDGDTAGWIKVKWDKSDFEENYRFGLEMEFDVVPPGGIEVVPWPEGLCYEKPDESDEESDGDDIDIEAILASNTYPLRIPRSRRKKAISKQERTSEDKTVTRLQSSGDGKNDENSIQNDFDAPEERSSAMPKSQYIWQYTDDDGKWTAYYQDIQRKLETGFQQRPNNSVLIKYGVEYERVSFEQMKQRNTHTGKERSVCRREIDVETFDRLMKIVDD